MKHRPPRRPPADAQAQLDELYASLPTIDCRGQCWDSCGSVGMTPPEQARIEDRHRVRLPLQAVFAGSAAGPTRCPALTMLGRCGVYPDRPLICRLWGLVPSMRCNFGCIPDGGLMTEQDGHLAIAQALDIAGDRAGAAALREAWGTPEAAARSEALLRRLGEDRTAAYQVRVRAAQRDGSAVYMTAGGRLVREPTKQAGTF